MLALLDIDGTLLEAPSLIHSRAVERSAREVYGAVARVSDLGPDAHHGLTSPAIARNLLRHAGVDDAVVEARFASWRAAMVQAYLALQDELPEQRPFPDARAALDALAARGIALGLLTGNFRAVAEAKLRRAGAWHEALDLTQGAFGDDAEDRDELSRIARRRLDAAGGGALAIIGDTPRDVDCARAAGAAAVAVATGIYDAAALRGADAVVGSLSEAAAWLLAARAAR